MIFESKHRLRRQLAEARQDLEQAEHQREAAYEELRRLGYGGYRLSDPYDVLREEDAAFSVEHLTNPLNYPPQNGATS